jgi:hypothetical protein
VTAPVRFPRRPLRSMAATNRRHHRPAPPPRRLAGIPWGHAAPLVDPGLIPDRQRAALAWRLRDALARADRRAAKYDAYPTRREQVRVDNLRGEVLGLVDELETGTQQRRG